MANEKLSKCFLKLKALLCSLCLHSKLLPLKKITMVSVQNIYSQKDGVAGKTPAIKPGDMNSVARTHIMKGENQFPQVVPCSTHVHHGTHTCAHTYTNI